MEICENCAYCNEKDKKGNYLCAFKKLKNPFDPGLYLINKFQKACSDYRKKEVSK